LHIQNVVDSVIRVANAVDGAIHVTACHELELYATSHQLRMHESSSLACHTNVNSGPILEDCTGIVFYAGSKEDLVHDAKDFNWLRNGVPSPNFCIVEENCTDNTIDTGVTNDEHGGHLVDPTSNETGIAAEEAQHNPDTSTCNVLSGGQSDDDDEL